MPPLITPGLRRPVVVVVALAVALVVVLGALVWHGGTTRLDSWVWRELLDHLDGQQRYRLLQFSDPKYTTSMLTGVFLAALAGRRPKLAVLAVAAPLLALFVTEIVLKPLVSRHIAFAVPGVAQISQVRGSFPSGHETAVFAAAMVLAVAAGQLRPARAVWWLIGIVLAVWPVLAALGLVRSFYHYATDIAGAAGVSAAVVLSTALALDAAGARLSQRRATRPVSSPDGRSLSRSSPAA